MGRKNIQFWFDYINELPVDRRNSYDGCCDCTSCQSVRDDFREWIGNYTISDNEIKGYPDVASSEEITAQKSYRLSDAEIDALAPTDALTTDERETVEFVSRGFAEVPWHLVEKLLAIINRLDTELNNK